MMKNNSSLSCETCPLKDRAACKVLKQEERAQLSKIGHHLTVKRGETVFSAGDNNDISATLTSGALKISSFDSDGNEHILSLVHPAGFVGELFAPSAHHHIIALTDSQLCIFDRKRYEEAIERFPALAIALLQRTSDELHQSRNLIELIGQSASASISGLLLEFARAASHSPCHIADYFELPLSRGDIANLLGVKIETVSRIIRKFDRDGIIKLEGNRGVKICDQIALEGLTI